MSHFVQNFVLAMFPFFVAPGLDAQASCLKSSPPLFMAHGPKLKGMESPESIVAS